jgi:DNA-directed RNA polymerase specialized sigma subunit
MPRTLHARAYRDAGKCWTIEIPELTSTGPNGSTIIAIGGAVALKDVDQAARDLAAVWLDVDEDEIAVEVTVELPEAAATMWAEANENEEHSREAAAEAARLRREAVQTLKKSGLTQVDVARALGLSPQRISQLSH